MIKKNIMITISLILITGLYLTSLNSFAQPTLKSAKVKKNSLPQNNKTIPYDRYPPVLHSSQWHQPVPLPGRANTAGAEDSPFITPDANQLYLWYTPDPQIPPEQQILDGVTGIYVSYKQGRVWSQAQRIILQDKGRLALDGCAFVDNNKMWFCSAREGYTDIHWFSAEFIQGQWQNWQHADDIMSVANEVGELHIASNGNELYFHSSIPGGLGQSDIWISRKSDGRRMEPENISAVNSSEREAQPFISQDGQEMWFTRWHQGSPAIFRSKRNAQQWQEPELIISQFAGEPTLDREGNIYFVHHYFRDGRMIESDIYVAYRKHEQ
ncbi:MAG: hypothetical protein Q8O13_05020 [Candidatus Omnitrophota bacterium]|nr:hypothetical protein [Candidatus Omnitrophota bacterium]